MSGLTPDIETADLVRHGVPHLTFADGVTGELDVLDRMRDTLYERIRTGSWPEQDAAA
jgi:hypothetical protein